MKIRCLECGSEQATDAGECDSCGAPIGAQSAGPAVTITGWHRAELRIDERGIRVKNSFWEGGGVKRVVGWDEVRWLRDGPRLSRRTRWVLEIVLKDGGVASAQASRSGTVSAAPQTLQAIRRATRHHAIPAVLTGRPVERFQPVGGMPKAGLYPDPGGEPGLREWDGTEWSPVLHTDPSGDVPGGTVELATTWSPLPKQAQQQHWESAAAALRDKRASVRALVVLTLIVAGLLLAGLVVACYWLASPGADVPVGAKAAVGVTDLFLALCTAGLLRAIRHARLSVRRHQRIAEVAKRAAWRANAQDVEAPPETTWIVPGPRDTQLRFDDYEITLRTRRQTRWIAWNDVRWFRDGNYFHLSRRLRNEGWALAIALKDGSVVIPDATRKPRQASQQTLTAVSQAARHHAIPAVLTGRPVRDKPSPADKPGFYPDPGGQPGLREWTGTEWLPSLLVDPATSGPHGEDGQASTWSPLSREDQQRQWDAAIAAVPRWYQVVLGVLGLAVGLAICWVVPPIFVVQRAVQHGYWLGMSPAAAVPLYAAIFLWTCGWGAFILSPVHNRRATAKVARAARAGSARAATEATTPASSSTP
jgi:Protein of unknown function (DUF2510)